MADPVVHLTAGVPDGGTGNITTLGAVVAKQPALGTAGAASADVITVQGVASMTALKVDGSTVTQPVSGTVTVTNYGAAFTRAAGASDANTQRVTIDSGQLGSLGRQIPSGSAPVVAASQTYKTVAASQTATVMGATGATGDYIDGVLVIPATTSPGNVILLDASTSITIFTGGATSVSDLRPFFIPIGAISASGAWKLTTGANVSVIGVGNFT